MKKINLLFLFIIIIVIGGCEKDDFCTQNPVTPNLVLRFYDKDDTTELKEVKRLSVIAEGKTENLITNQTTNNITIPLNTLSQETVYTIRMNNVDENSANDEIATLTIKYDTEEVFVSRSCGYRVIFNDVNFEFTGWIDSLSTILINTIDNQTEEEHVQIFH